MFKSVQYYGCTEGLVFNGLRLLELAAEGDDRIAITGDVQMEVKPLRHQHGGFVLYSNCRQYDVSICLGLMRV